MLGQPLRSGLLGRWPIQLLLGLPHGMPFRRFGSRKTCKPAAFKANRIDSRAYVHWNRNADLFQLHLHAKLVFGGVAGERLPSRRRFLHQRLLSVRLLRRLHHLRRRDGRRQVLAGVGPTGRNADRIPLRRSRGQVVRHRPRFLLHHPLRVDSRSHRLWSHHR